MKHRGKWTATLVSALTILILPNLAASATYYVDTAGTDVIGGLLNTCQVELTPCKTITHTFDQVNAGTAGDPSVIEAKPGIYVNGELYPIILTKDDVSLVGADAVTTIIDGTGTTAGSALVVNAKGFSLSRFTFRNIETGLTISQGGFTISDNVFEDTVVTGVSSDITNLSETEDFTVAPISLTGNTFTGINNGIKFKIGLVFDGSAVTGLNAIIGDITFTDNSFTDCHNGIDLNELYIVNIVNGTATVGNITATGNSFMGGYRGIELGELYVESMANSTVTWGNITLDNNSFTGNDYAIETSGWFGSENSGMVDTTLTVGNVSVSSNTFTDNNDQAITIDYFDVSSLSGSSTATLGDLLVQNNTIETDTEPVSGGGIKINDIGHIEYIYDASTVTTGSVTVSGNSVESSSDALSVSNEGVYYIGVDGGTDTAIVSCGSTTITDNPKLSSTNSKGLYLDINYFGYDQYAETRVNAGLITVNNNVISSENDDGMYMYYYYSSGYSMGDDATLDIAGLTFTNNHITSTNRDGANLELYELGYGLNGNSKIEIGPTAITGNTIEGNYYALYLNFDEYIAYEMYDSSSFTMAPWNVSGNTLTAADSEALTIYYYDYYVGSNMENDSSARLPDWTISNNEIDVSGGNDGIYYYTYSNPDDNYDNATVQYGSILIDNNVFNRDKNDGMDSAINFWIEDVCEDCYDSSTFSHGDITITNNSIYNAEDTGVNVEYDDIGYSFDDAGKVTMGKVTIADNLIDTARNGIYAGYASIKSEASAVVTLATLDITGNTVQNITNEGITFDISAYMSTGDLSTAAVIIGKTTISDNMVTASATTGAESSGIWINGDIDDGVVFTPPDINNNTVTGFGVGIGMEDLPEASISCNSVENSTSSGLFFLSDGTFTAVNNSLVDNGMGLKIEDSSTAAITAENNWWGDAAGPAACASCNKIDAGGGTVTFTPWLSSQPNGQCGSFPWNLFMPAITGMKPL